MVKKNKINQILSDSEERFRILSEYAQEGIVLSEDHIVVDANEQVLKMFGYKDRSEVIGKSFDDVVHPDHLAGVVERVSQPDTKEHDVLCYKKDGSEIIVRAKGRLIPFHGHTIRVSVLTDITLQRKEEEKLIESEKHYRNLFENNLAAIFRSEVGGGILEINTALVEIFEYSSVEELKKVNAQDLYFSQEEREEYIRQLRAKGYLKNYQMRMKKKGGAEVWVLENVMLIKDSQTHKEYIKGNMIDITETRRIQQALQESEQNYKSLIEHTPTGILIHNYNGETLYANPAVLNMIGLGAFDNVKEKNIFHYVLPEYHEIIRNRSEDVGKGITFPFLEIKIRKPDDSVMEVEIQTNRISYLGNPAVEVVLRDIALQRQLEREHLRYQIEEETNRELKREIASHIRTRQRLNANQKYTRLLLDSSIDMICACDEDGDIAEFNYQAQNIFGYSSKEVLGKDFSILYENIPQYEKIRAIVSEDGNFLGEVNYKKKNGEIFPVYISASVLKNERGEDIGMMSIARDISGIKETEDQLKRSVHEKDILLKEIHHRVKNNMQVISSILKLQSAYVKDKRTIELLDECRNRIASMAFIHATLYMTKDFTNINLSEYVNNIAGNLKQSYLALGKNVSLEQDIPSISLHIDDAIPCGLIINELLSNALKYGFVKRKSGRVGIYVKVKKENIILAVWDDGVGFPKNIDYKNTQSLGLQLVISLTEQLRGKIKLESKSGEGTKFILAFKRSFNKI